jgi:hypothetical protein
VTCFRISYSCFHSSSSSVGIPNGAIAGIVVGIFFGVVVFPVLGFIFWRRRRRGEDKDFTFIEPSIHKGYDITEGIEIRPASLGPQRKISTQSPINEVSLDLFPVSIPQSTHPQSRASLPTFPRSPTISLPSQTKESSGRITVHTSGAIDPRMGVPLRSPPTVESENIHPSNLNRRGSVPKPSGPRPQSHRTSTGDPRRSATISPAHVLTEPGPIQGKEPSEHGVQQVNGEEDMTTYSFLDMNSTSVSPSIMEGLGKSQNATQSSMNLDRHLPIASSSSVRSRRNSDMRRESRSSRQLSLSAVIRQLPLLKLRRSTELHPYSPRYPQTPQSHRPPTGGASPTESVPVTTSEVSEIRFYGHGEGSESNASQERGGQDSHPASLKAAAVTSPIYQKLFGTLQGEVPPDGLLARKHPLRRKELSASTFDTPPQV